MIHTNNAAGIDCNLLIEDGRYQIQSPNILNAPPWIDPTYGHFFIDVLHHMDNWVRQIAYEVNSIRIYTRACLAGSWSQWEPLATATPPQEFDLPLADGITALQPCTYYKNRLGEVTVGGAVAGTISQDTIIGTLPVGYRPSKVIERPATIGTGSVRYPGSVFVNPYGVITITTPASEMAAVFEASFLAKN